MSSLELGLVVLVGALAVTIVYLSWRVHIQMPREFNTNAVAIREGVLLTVRGWLNGNRPEENSPKYLVFMSTPRPGMDDYVYVPPQVRDWVYDIANNVAAQAVSRAQAEAEASRALTTVKLTDLVGSPMSTEEPEMSFFKIHFVRVDATGIPTGHEVQVHVRGPEELLTMKQYAALGNGVIELLHQYENELNPETQEHSLTNWVLASKM